MAQTQAVGGFGTRLQRDDGTGTFSDIAEIQDVSGPAFTQEIVDATHMQSDFGWAERIAVGLRDAGDVTFTMSALQGDASQNLLVGDLNASTRRNFQILFPGGTKKIGFAAFVKEIGHDFKMRDKIVRNVTLAVTGKPVIQ